MSKKNVKQRQSSAKQDYKTILRRPRIELVKLQNQIIRSDAKILVLLEGRDATGKGSLIKGWA